MGGRSRETARPLSPNGRMVSRGRPPYGTLSHHFWPVCKLQPQKEVKPRKKGTRRCRETREEGRGGAEVGCSPFSKGACGVIREVLLILCSSARMLPFATAHLPEFRLAYFFWGLCPGVGGRGPQALGIRRPQRSGVRGRVEGVVLRALPAKG